MIIAVVDDLMFASKISTVAKAVKVDVVFVPVSYTHLTLPTNREV